MDRTGLVWALLVLPLIILGAPTGGQQNTTPLAMSLSLTILLAKPTTTTPRIPPQHNHQQITATLSAKHSQNDSKLLHHLAALLHCLHTWTAIHTH
ncbi:hypothetical protein [uncultured Photobacterium sp.]|uniref:hypothetical protein n=1 Tax=uncultured Photobacterium sp. TaxID=173973 RepID=UPI002630B156|nr:hypothetical protein [uncultured Photobacterium sp.]